jgi:hypothetical protein
VLSTRHHDSGYPISPMVASSLRDGNRSAYADHTREDSAMRQ